MNPLHRMNNYPYPINNYPYPMHHDYPMNNDYPMNDSGQMNNDYPMPPFPALVEDKTESSSESKDKFNMNGPGFFPQRYPMNPMMNNYPYPMDPMNNYPYPMMNDYPMNNYPYPMMDDYPSPMNHFPGPMNGRPYPWKH